MISMSVSFGGFSFQLGPSAQMTEEPLVSDLYGRVAVICMGGCMAERDETQLSDLYGRLAVICVAVICLGGWE